jgi:flagellar hook protein FlgE
MSLMSKRSAGGNQRFERHNIANAGTVGRQSRAEFADVALGNHSSVAAPMPLVAVQLANVSQQFKQGNVNNTQNGFLIWRLTAMAFRNQ